MATTQNTSPGNGTLNSFTFTFEYLEESDVYVSLTVDSTQAKTELTRTTNWVFANATTITFNSIASATVWQETTGAPKTGVTVRIYRVTGTDSAQATFFAGSAIRAQDLNNNNTQLLYATQETVNRRIDSTGGTMSGDLNMGGNKISNVADPTVGTDVVTKDYLDTFSFNPAGTGNVDFTGNITVAGTSTFTGVGTFNNDVTINSTGYLKLPVGTTLERPGTAAVGMVRFNSTTGKFEGSPDGTNWSLLGGGATGGGADTVFFENSNTVTTEHTITAGKNAVSAGPITINSGITVEVPAGQSWVIV